MANGIKSKYFGCYWSSMFMTAMCMPEKIDNSNPDHLKKVKNYKRYYDSFQYIIPCKYCRDFTRDILMKEYPLEITGRIPLMKSIYIWKKVISEKLISQGCKTTKPSPPFETVLAKYDKMTARCSKKLGKCV